MTELNYIASEPHATNIILAPNFRSLRNFEQQLIDDTCSGRYSYSHMKTNQYQNTKTNVLYHRYCGKRMDKTSKHCKTRRIYVDVDV